MQSYQKGVQHMIENVQNGPQVQANLARERMSMSNSSESSVSSTESTSKEIRKSSSVLGSIFRGSKPKSSVSKNKSSCLDGFFSFPHMNMTASQGFL